MKFNSALALAAILMALMVAIEANDQANNELDAAFTCPSQYGYYQHPDCHKFWQCSNWIGYEMPCAPGTMWNQTLLTCDHLTTCGSDNPVEEPASTKAPEEPTEAPEDPTTEAAQEPSTAAPEPPTLAPVNPDDGKFKCPAEYGYFQHKNCWQYWQCGNWIASEMTCAPATEWAQDLLTCDHITTCQRPQLPTSVPVEPSTTIAPTTPQKTDAPTTTTKVPTTTTKAPKTTTKAPKTTTKVPDNDDDDDDDNDNDFECPYRNGAFEHKTCYKFWLCKNWKAYEMKCDPYTQFSRSVSECVHQTTCQRPDNPVRPTEKTTTTKRPKTTTTQAPDDDDDNDSNFQCPYRNGAFEHPTCYKFWLCLNWVPRVMTCDPYTQFSRSVSECVHQTTCQRPDNPVRPTEKTTTTKRPKTTTTKAPKTTTTTQTPDDDDNNGNFECPYRNGAFEHPTCYKFWLCLNWVPREMTCDPYTQFSRSVSECIHQTTCQRPDNPWPPAQSTTTRRPTKAPTTTTQAPDDDNDNDDDDNDNGNDDDFECPNRHGNYPHQDCWKFWQCRNYVPYEITCAPHTQFDERIRNCRNLTTCKRPTGIPTTTKRPKTTTTKAPKTTTTKRPKTTTQRPDDDDNDSNFQCPYRNGAFEHPTCYKFWLCLNWVPREMTCDPYTQFSRSVSECIHQTTCQRPDNPWPTEKTTKRPKTTTTKRPKTTTTKAPKTTTTKAPSGGDFECPNRHGNYPHQDCWKFWQCRNYVPYEITCAPYTQFDERIRNCRNLTTCQRPFWY